MEYFISHNAANELRCTHKKYANFCFDLLSLLFQNDVKSKDITSNLLLPNSMYGAGKIVAHDSGVVAGLEEIEFFLRKEVSLKNIRFSPLVEDGANVKNGVAIATLEGSILDLLKVERVILNVLQRMSGIATQTSLFVEHVPKNVLIVPTRKTLWGYLDKKACTLGGAGTHRLDLQDAILVKDNHLTAIHKNFLKLLKHLAEIPKIQLKKMRFVEVEVASFQEFTKLLDAYEKFPLHFSLYVMLDNFKLLDVQRACRYLLQQHPSRTIYLEASGGITLKNIHQYAKTGVHIISSGALTHSAPAFDYSFELGKF